MTRFNAASKETARRARAIAIEVNQGVEQQTFRTRKVMVLLAVVVLGTAMATHAFAAGRMGGMGGGPGLGGGFHGRHMSHEFQPPVLDEAPSMPAPRSTNTSSSRKRPPRGCASTTRRVTSKRANR